MIVESRSLAFALCMLFPCLGLANIELPYLFSDGAVVQRGMPVPVWGQAPAHSQVVVKLGAQEQRVQSNSEGQWSSEFPAKKAGETMTLTVSSGGDTRTVSDIIAGDLWVCSGQSNMEWTLQDTLEASSEIEAANNPSIRHFKVPRSWAATPEHALAGGDWKPATAEFVGDFSGVGYYFAKKVYAETGIPIGIIHSSWGGSNIESWMSPRALGKTAEEVQDSLEKMFTEGEKRARKVIQNLAHWNGAYFDGAYQNLVEQANADWSMEKLAVTDWRDIKTPAHWEQQGYTGVDGVVWYRKTFALSQVESEGGITLGLGRIDDRDTTWVNGHKVGETDHYNQVREYTVPAKYLHAGVNQIAIRVEDTGGGGGIFSDENLLYVKMADGVQESLAGVWKIKADKVIVKTTQSTNHTDTVLYNKMMVPLFRVPVKGVLWYQGESNAGSASQALNYAQQFKAMISDWRRSWQAPKLPFYWVQLANFVSNGDTEKASPWAILRESQTAALELPATGQAITIDVGNPEDIHPRDKKSVGQRLALIALNKDYGKRKLSYRGPVFKSAKWRGNKLRVNMKVSGKLKTSDNSQWVTGFEFAGKDGRYSPIKGKLDKRKVIFDVEGKKNPWRLRYAWSDNPESANLQDTQGLPAGPFRIQSKK